MILDMADLILSPLLADDNFQINSCAENNISNLFFYKHHPATDNPEKNHFLTIVTCIH